MKVSLKNNESGFTLLEALIAMMLSSIIVLFLGSNLQQLNKINELVIADAQFVLTAKSKVKGSRQIEWHMFLNQLERYLENTELVSSTTQSIIVNEEKAGHTDYTRTKYGRSETGYRSFYRSKNNGHNAMLTEVQSFRIEVDGQWLLLNFSFQNDEEYKGRIWIESWEQKNNPDEN